MKPKQNKITLFSRIPLVCLAIFFFFLWLEAVPSARAQVCNDFCDEDTRYYDGVWDDGMGDCVLWQTEVCAVGCSGGVCVTCDNFCDGNTRYYDGFFDPGLGDCVFESEICPGGCTPSGCADPCATVVCDDFCDGNTRRYDGVCDPGLGDCVFSGSEPCDDYCDGNTRRYNAYCDAGSGACVFPDSEICPGGCTPSGCADPCDDVVCDDFCDGNTRRYDGECDQGLGDCVFSGSEVCPGTCSGGVCVATPPPPSPPPPSAPPPPAPAAVSGSSWTNPADLLKIKIPLVQLTSPAPCPHDPTKLCVPWLSQYISGVYRYAVGVVGILAAFALMLGGITWVAAGGSAERIGNAKSWIGAGLTGLMLVLASYMILYQVNPDLLNPRPIAVKQVQKIDPPSSAVCRLMPHDPAAAGGGCGEGLTQTAYGLCGAEQHWTDPEPEKICCCPRFGGEMIYGHGIKLQLGDASNELKIVLNCMRNNMPEGVGRISSISDSNWIGNLTICDNLDFCAGCVHACQSCHYGGGTGSGKSYAVDYGDEENAAAIKHAYEQCRSDGAKYFKNEGDHIHISVRPCPKN